VRVGARNRHGNTSAVVGGANLAPILFSIFRRPAASAAAAATQWLTRRPRPQAS